MTPETHHPSWRKPLGALAILGMIMLWVGVIVGLSDPVGLWPVYAQTIFYIVAGVSWLWVLPLRRMLAWMETGRWRR